MREGLQVPLFPILFDEPGNASVVGPLLLPAKIAGWKFSHISMVVNAFAADPVPLTSGVRAVADCPVFCIVVALHVVT